MKEILEKIAKASFITTDEMYQNKEKIREEFQKFDNDTKRVYKWYFYFQLCMLKNPLKEKLWNYINKEELNYKDIIGLYNEFAAFNKKRMQIAEYQRKQDEKKKKLLEEQNNIENLTNEEL